MVDATDDVKAAVADLGAKVQGIQAHLDAAAKGDVKAAFNEVSMSLSSAHDKIDMVHDRLEELVGRLDDDAKALESKVRRAIQTPHDVLIAIGLFTVFGLALGTVIGMALAHHFGL